MEQEKKKTLTLGGKLELGKMKSGQVPQSLSHGRVRSVTVEVKKKRSFKKDGQPDNASQLGEKAFAHDANSSLTRGEQETRLRALHKATEDDKRQKEEVQIRAKLEEEKRIREEEEERKRQEQAEIEKILAVSEEVEEVEDEPAEESETKDLAVAKVISETPENEFVKPIKGSERIGSTIVKKVKVREEETAEEQAAQKKKIENKRRSNKLTIAQALSGGGEERVRSLASVRRAREKARRLSGESLREKEKIIREVIVPEVITVQELSNRMAERVYDVTKTLMKLGMVVTANQTIDADTAELIVAEFGHKLRRVKEADVENVLNTEVEDLEKGRHRAPVVTFMGHVDHGKTSLLDAIRNSHVAKGESGGITQHIGAYQVQTDSGHKITFLDTPGHEAFTAMRQRGANATDIVVLVVAADDGIMAQTVEAINHAKAANVPIIVAINKIDKPDANPLAVRNALLSHNLVTESMGGDVLAVEVSAKQGTNLDKLLEAILLQSEVLELKADPGRKAQGVVIEAKLDKGKGVVATFLMQKGTLRTGDLIIAGEAYGRIRAMIDASGAELKEAGPSVPVEILGLNEAPEAGVEFAVVETERQAREIVEYRQRRARDIKSAIKRKTSLEDLFERAGEGGIRELPILIKGDVQGSVEAIAASLAKIGTEEVQVKILHSGVGAITGSDVTLANASHAIILGFNVRSDVPAKEMINRDGVDVRYYSIIYDLVDDIKAILGGMLKPVTRENYLGNAVIREVFSLSKKAGKVAGCMVTDGVIKRGAGVRLLRENVVIYTGKLKTLRRFKDDVKEVSTNFECGIAFENFDDIKPGDTIEAYDLVQEARTL